MFDQSRGDIIGETDVEMLGIETFEDIDVFHQGRPWLVGARLRSSAFALRASADKPSYGVAAFARFATRELGWLAKP
jgi:hypothetical protein